LITVINVKEDKQALLANEASKANFIFIGMTLGDLFWNLKLMRFS